MPSLALPFLKSYLEQKSHLVVQHDLNYRFYEMVNFEVTDTVRSFIQKETILNYLNRGVFPTEYKMLFEKLTKDFEIDTYDVVGISTGSSFSLFEIHFSLALGKYIKDKYGKKIIFGGANMQYIYLFKKEYDELFEAILDNFKYIIIGPGETPLEQLLNNIDDPSFDEIYTQIPGAVYRRNGEIEGNQEARMILTRPDFRGLNMDDYKVRLNKNVKNEVDIYYRWPYWLGALRSIKNGKKLPEEQIERKLIIPYIFNIYCPGRCIFCEQSDELKKFPASNAVDTVISDIKHLMEEYNSAHFVFLNNAINVNKRFVTEFCNRLIQEDIKITWSDCARVFGLDKQTLELMSKAGCRKLIFGMETGSSKLLKYINKNLDLDQLRQVLKWCNELNILAEVETIVGFPYEDSDEFQLTYDFIIENSRYLNFFYLNRFFVVPTSLLGKYPEKYGIELCGSMTYDKLIQRNLRQMKAPLKNEADEVGTTLFNVLKFEEINGRKYPEISKTTAMNYLKLKRLQISMPVMKEI